MVALQFGLLLAAKPAHGDTTFTVNRTGDESELVAIRGNGVCDALPAARGNQCSLRAAIQEANATAGADTIEFGIADNPNVPGLEVKTITPNSSLPTISDRVSIDGYTQAGASENSATTIANSAVLKIQLSGANAPSNAFGLAVSGTGAAGSTIKGLASTASAMTACSSTRPTQS
jgi:CSLREA domain-containing protein